MQTKTSCVSVILTTLFICTHNVNNCLADTLAARLADTAVRDDGASLVLVQVVFRHGDRSPMHAYPTDPHQEKDWPRGFGQLSKMGMMQHYKLGQYFKRRYTDGQPYRLLNESYVVNELHVRSSDIDRTLMSAYSNLAGLYPPTTEEKWDPDLLWQPIPVHTVPVEEDYVLSTDASCPRADKLFNETMNSPAVKEEEKSNAGFYKFISNMTGVPHEGVRTIWAIQDAVVCEKRHNLTQPDWVDQYWNNTEVTVFEKLDELDDYEFVLKYQGPEKSRLKGGSLLKEMINNMRGKINGSTLQKFFMYSSHDTMVAAFSCALNIYNGLQPPYASTLIVELFNSTAGYTVKVWYRNDSTAEAYPMHIPGCGDPCNFTKFVEVTADRIPDDIIKECQLPTSAPVLSNDKVIFITIGAFLFLVFVIGMILLLMRKCRGTRSPYERYYGIQVAA